MMRASRTPIVIVSLLLGSVMLMLPLGGCYTQLRRSRSIDASDDSRYEIRSPAEELADASEPNPPWLELAVDMSVYVLPPLALAIGWGGQQFWAQPPVHVLATVWHRGHEGFREIPRLFLEERIAGEWRPTKYVPIVAHSGPPATLAPGTSVTATFDITVPGEFRVGAALDDPFEPEAFLFSSPFGVVP